MKIKEEINDYKKEWVHNCYTRIIVNFKDYEKISRKQMIDEVVEYYANYENILNICSYKELLLLKKISKSKKIFDVEETDKFEFYELRDKFLLSNHYKNGIHIPDEIIKSVELALKKTKKKDYEQKDSLNELLIGILKIYGVLTPNEFYEIVLKYMNIDIDDFNYHVKTDKYLQFYCYYVDYKNEQYILYEPYYYISDSLLSNIDRKIPFTIRSKEEVIYLRYHQFNENNKNILKFLNEVNKLVFFQSSLFDAIENYVVLDSDRTELIASFKNIPALKNQNLSFVIDLMNKAMDDMPSATLRGATRYEFLFNTKKQEYDNRYKQTYNRLKNNNNIVEYKKIRESANVVFDNCISYALQNNLIDKFNEFLINNDLVFKPNDTNVVMNFTLFHSINDELSVFDEYYNKYINILNVNYKIFNQFKTSYHESLFKMKKMDSKTGKVILEDIFSKEIYIIMDVALSCGSKEILGNYIYTTLITIDNYTFTTDYSLIIINRKNKDIIEELKVKMNSLKSVTNETTKRFIACYLLFIKEDIRLTKRVLN